MNGVIGDILPLAVGVAISPIPIIAAILMLFSAHAGSTSTGFLIGWVLGIVVATGLFTLLSGSLGASDQPAGVSWVKVGLGAVLVMAGLRQWRGRHEHKGPPKWMAAIDRMGFVQALGLGFALSAINPKNLLMAAAAGVAIGAGGLSVGDDIIVIAIFTVIAASTVAIPVIAYAVAKDRMRRPLDEAKGWLQDNNAAVMAVLFLVIGAVLIGKGIGGF
ncbi:MAG TPA: GAP family protein [Nakamurella sp.]